MDRKTLRQEQKNKQTWRKHEIVKRLARINRSKKNEELFARIDKLLDAADVPTIDVRQRPKK